MTKTYGRFTVSQETDEEGTFYALRNEWGEDLWTYDTLKEACKEARRLARDEELDAEAMARDGH
jgi:hypothetical protein